MSSVQVNFLTKLVALKPGKTVQEMIKNVMQGKDEGADNSEGDKEDSSSGKFSGGIAGRVSFTTLDIQILSRVGKRILVGLINKLKKHSGIFTFS